MAIPKAEWIWFNDEFVPWDSAHVHVTSHALHYGSSGFEGIRAYATRNGPAILGLNAHIHRMINSCRIIRLDLPYSQEQLENACIETVRRNKHASCYIRPIAFRGSDSLSVDGRSCPTEVVIITFEWGRYLGEDAIEQGVDVMVSSWRRMALDTSPVLAKAGGNYLNCQFIAMEAKDNGFIEGIALDTLGFVSEGGGENIFVIQDNVIYTPPIGSSILLGITRGYAITLARELGYEVQEQMIPRDMLYTAEEIFFTGTAAEITPVRSVDRVKVGSGSRGQITKRLQEEFFGIVSGEITDRHGWLTVVN
jgi:branched-chain amino acid aminotransferase